MYTRFFQATEYITVFSLEDTNDLIKHVAWLVIFCVFIDELPMFRSSVHFSPRSSNSQYILVSADRFMDVWTKVSCVILRAMKSPERGE